METNSEWPFDQAPNVAAFTLRRIFNGETQILRVCHDIDDDGWQFLDGLDINIQDAMLVSMKEIVNFDNTVTEIAHIPPGKMAIRRFIGDEWIIADNPSEPTDD